MATASRIPHVEHILLAEFDIAEGSKVSFQHPRPTGTDLKCATVAPPSRRRRAAVAPRAAIAAR